MKEKLLNLKKVSDKGLVKKERTKDGRLLNGILIDEKRAERKRT